MAIKTVLRVCKNYEEMSECTARKIFTLSISSKKQRKIFTVAISGGDTPRRIFKHLASLKQFPWAETHFFWTDERWVPIKSGRSNFKLFQDQLRRVKLNQVHAHPIFIPHTSARKGARLYEDHIRKFFKLSKSKLPKFDLVVLGVGEDGHIASLFPWRRELDINNKLVVHVPKFGKNREERVSLTLPVINNARNILFIAAGKKKAGVIKQLFGRVRSRTALPAMRVNPRKGTLVWFLDKKAAAYVE